MIKKISATVFIICIIFVFTGCAVLIHGATDSTPSALVLLMKKTAEQELPTQAARKLNNYRASDSDPSIMHYIPNEFGFTQNKIWIWNIKEETDGDETIVIVYCGGRTSKFRLKKENGKWKLNDINPRPF